MKSFVYEQASTTDEAARAVARQPNAMFLAGGTTLVDLMKIDVLTPDTLIHVGQLTLNEIEVESDQVRVGANVRNSQLAWHPVIRTQFPVLSEALLSGATAQLRNMATVAGNIMQRTRCPYYRDIHAACNRRVRGAGCDAMLGFNRGHAVLGTSDSCIATHPSDMCVAMVILDAVIHTLKADGTTRAIPFNEFHRAPGDTPDIETNLEHGELITHLVLPKQSIGRRSYYLKVRDRTSYEFALASAAVALDLDGNHIRSARIGLGGIATKPWRCVEAEQALGGEEASEAAFQHAADVALAAAIAREHNRFKIELAKRTIVRALSIAKDRSV